MKYLIDSIYIWILGSCVQWNWEHKMFVDTSSDEFKSFVDNTHKAVYPHVVEHLVAHRDARIKRFSVDPASSNLERTLIHEACKTFRL